MSFNLELPTFPAGNDNPHIAEIYRYLFQQATQLNYALSFLDLPDSSPTTKRTDDSARVASISNKSTHAQTASAKAVYDYAVPVTRKVNNHALNADLTLGPTDLGEADYVTETGSNEVTGWRWRKWNSGIMEAWVASLACAAESWSAWGSTGMSIAHLSFDLPVTFYDTQYCVDVSVSRGATGGRAAIPLSSRHVSASAASITIMTATEFINIADYMMDIHVIGRWK